MRQEKIGFGADSGISCTVWKQSAPCSRQITTTAPHHSRGRKSRKQTNFEISRDGASVFAGPHRLNEGGVRCSDLAAHAERILGVEFIAPPIRQHVIRQWRNIAHALHSIHSRDILQYALHVFYHHSFQPINSNIVGRVQSLYIGPQTGWPKCTLAAFQPNEKLSLNFAKSRFFTNNMFTEQQMFRRT